MVILYLFLKLYFNLFLVENGTWLGWKGPANPYDFPLVDDENHAQSVGQFQKSIKLTLQVFLYSSLKNIRVLIVLKNNINENKSYQHM